MPTPFPNGTHVEIVVRTRDLKLRVQGVVQSVHPGFGMGVKLVLKTAEHHDHVQSGEYDEVNSPQDPWTR
jgi:hypothetical protein